MVITFSLAGMDRTVFFSRGGGLNLLYATAKETMICIELSEVSQIYPKFIIMIAIMITISVSLSLSGIGKIRERHLYFAPPLPRGFDQGCFTGRDRKGVSRGKTARVFHGVSLQGCFTG